MINIKNGNIEIDVKSVVVVSKYTDENQTQTLMEYCKASFDVGIAFKFVCFALVKKNEQLPELGENLIFITQKDFNFLGRLNKDKKSKLEVLQSDVLLCNTTENNKSVNKLCNHITAKIKIGLKQNTLTNFDLQFDTSDVEGEMKLIKLFKKYFKL